MHAAAPHLLHSGRQTPTPSCDNTAQAQQLLAYQQMQHMPMKILPAYYGPQSTYALPTNTTYGPNSIYIPNDRFVRPPATSRLAPLFAQSGAWQANSVSTATPKPEIQSHFSTPVPRARDTRRLTYVEGSDDMYPQSSLGKGGSVRYQILSRPQPPNYSLVTDDENIPFAESARAARPAEWGVMKLGNVSKYRPRPVPSFLSAICLGYPNPKHRWSRLCKHGVRSIDFSCRTMKQAAVEGIRLCCYAGREPIRQMTQPSNFHGAMQDADG